MEDIFVYLEDSVRADVIFKNIRRIWLIAKPLPEKYSTTAILPVWSSADMLAEFGVFSWQLSHNTLSAQYSAAE